jgi:hypothetical protein
MPGMKKADAVETQVVCPRGEFFFRRMHFADENNIFIFCQEGELTDGNFHDQISIKIIPLNGFPPK